VSGPVAAADVIEAIHDDRLVALLEAKLDDGGDDHRLRVADHITRSIAAVAARHADAVDAVLRDADIDGVLDPLPERQQRPVVSVRVTPDDLDTTRKALSAAGYAPLHQLSPGAWASYRRVHGETRFTSPSDDGAQVQVIWGDDRDPPRSPLHAMSRPGFDQWTGTDLPAWAWPGYVAVRMRDVVRHRIMGRPRSPAVGPHLPTPGDLVEPVLTWAGIGEGDVLLDAGCGDGRVLVEAARTIGCRGIGIEIDPALAELAVERARRAGVERLVTVVAGDIEHVPAPDTTAAFLFLPSGLIGAAINQLDRALPKGATIVAHEQSPLPDRPAAEDVAPVYGSSSLTVAHRWTVGGPR